MQYKGYIKLGNKYRDEITDTEGVALATSIFEFGCERTSLEWKDAGVVNVYSFDAPRLSSNPEEVVHESPIILGEQYEDRYTGIKGVATSLTFTQHGSENVTIEFKDKDGTLAEAYFDVGRLKPTSRAARQEVEATREERTTPVKTGGPMRGTSHIRNAPTRR